MTKSFRVVHTREMKYSEQRLSGQKTLEHIDQSESHTNTEEETQSE